ncbi:flagellar hook-basal body complex protein [Pelagovum sp. HNIBRBA483]|uniref:flagellar hook-basal body complex protein n=1 Tax=Pelagovum sp. HNIBRBA483 TaxID=3233341 RepID=UPI0034A4768C
MESLGYTTLSRQSGLLRELQVIANNIANMSTTGFRSEGILFTEFLAELPASGDSLSMAAARAHHISPAQGALTHTEGALDLAIEGAGYFLVQTPQGERLTRAGSFSMNAEGQLVTPSGHAVLSDGGGPITLPPEQAISIAADGTISAGGAPVVRLAVVTPQNPLTMNRTGDTLFNAPDGTLPAEATVRQGVLEDSNVDPIAQVARMIEVQRSYELGQSFGDREDERLRTMLRTLGK